MAVQPGANWRDSARAPRFFFVDAKAVFPLLLFLLHIRLWTFMLAIIAMTFFAILERFHFTVPIFFRWFKSQIAGKVRVAQSEWRS